MIENSIDYFSEKLFDAIISGVAPIYVGPRLAEMGLPNEIAIECGPSLHEIEKAYETLAANPELQQQIRLAGSKFLNSVDFDAYQNMNSLRDLGRKIGLYLKQEES